MLAAHWRLFCPSCCSPASWPWCSSFRRRAPATGDELLPDLQADSVGEADSTATYTDGGGSHLLLRFSSYIRNVGAGPLEVTGVNPVNRSISGDGIRIRS